MSGTARLQAAGLPTGPSDVGTAARRRCLQRPPPASPAPGARALRPAGHMCHSRGAAGRCHRGSRPLQAWQGRGTQGCVHGGELRAPRLLPVMSMCSSSCARWLKQQASPSQNRGAQLAECRKHQPSTLVTHVHSSTHSECLPHTGRQTSASSEPSPNSLHRSPTLLAPAPPPCEPWRHRRPWAAAPRRARHAAGGAAPGAGPCRHCRRCQLLPPGCSAAVLATPATISIPRRTMRVVRPLAVATPERSAASDKKKSDGALPASAPSRALARAERAMPPARLAFMDEEGQEIRPMPADYGFRSGSGRLYQQARGGWGAGAVAAAPGAGLATAPPALAHRSAVTAANTTGLWHNPQERSGAGHGFIQAGAACAAPRCAL